ncbi:DUF2953 domain-containing protein [Limnochorda pilosa]|uniref:DUF2953 domain-containing protein n=1 Tax=Limnochorda pilosa TaxID=1555112 RepID=UPI0009E88A43
MRWDAAWPLLALTAWLVLLFWPLRFRLDLDWPSPPGAHTVRLWFLLGPIRLRLPSRLPGRPRAGPVPRAWARRWSAGSRLWKLVEEVGAVEGEVEVGTGDAAESAFLSGVAWSVWGTALALLQRRVAIRQPPRVAIRPRYGQGGVAVRLRCILRTRLVHAMGVAPTLNAFGGRQHGRSDPPHGQRDAPHHGEPQGDGGGQHHPGGSRGNP